MFSNQRAGPFQILEPIGKLAYKLDLPLTMRTHPVISVSQLEPVSPGEDLTSEILVLNCLRW